MTEAEIAEMFIRAAETEAKLPEVKGLRPDYGRYALPWVHELADINGRGRIPGDKLQGADNPLEEWRMAWLTEWSKRATPKEIANWERCADIIRTFIDDAGQRRALWAWAMAQAGTLTRPASKKKISFARWCRDVEKVAEMTGHRRKKRAISSIYARIHGKADLHCENSDVGVLPVTHEITHVFATIEGQRAVYDERRVLSWRDDPSFNASTGMSLQEWRNAKRRAAIMKRKRAA